MSTERTLEVVITASPQRRKWWYVFHTQACLACVQDVVGGGMKRDINALLLMLFVTGVIKNNVIQCMMLHQISCDK